MKMYKLEVFLLGHNNYEDLTKRQMVQAFKEQFFNSDLSVTVGEVKETDIGDWYDEHPVNQLSTPTQTYRDYFDNDKALALKMAQLEKMKQKLKWSKEKTSDLEEIVEKLDEEING